MGVSVSLRWMGSILPSLTLVDLVVARQRFVDVCEWYVLRCVFIHV